MIKEEGSYMLWNELFDDRHEPLDTQIREFVNTPLWDDLTNYLQQTYKVIPKLFYSCCSMEKGFWKGWNIKYKKAGKSLCTLYPKQGYFIALIAVSVKEFDKADVIIPLCNKYTQELYQQTKLGTTGKSLAMEVTNKKILHDVKNLIALRVDSL
ncbi:MAG: DUF3788 domain-containing protein [Treponema sp.]|nr:DUF3788 domain-containing protein [Treponema sp.]